MPDESTEVKPDGKKDEGAPLLFVRRATGLVRELSAFDVFAWSIIFFPWLTSWAGIFWVTPAYYQNVNYYAGLAVWAVIAIVIVVLYWQLTSVMPRSGGDYIFISRTLSGPVGFVASFLFFVAILVSAGSGGYWALAETGAQLSFAGAVVGNPSVVSLGNAMTPGNPSSNPAALMAVGLLVLAVGTALVLRGGRALKWAIYAFFGYGAFVMLLVLGIFLSSSHAQFVSAYGTYFQGGVQKVFQSAAASGYAPGASLASLGAVVPLLFVSIGPYPVMQFVGSEIRRPRHSLLYGLVLAELVSIGVWFGLTYLLDSLVGIPFIEAWTVVNNYAPTVPTAFATVLNPNPVLLWLIAVGLIIGNIGWSWLSLVFISRLFLAWSFDRILPQSLAHVSERFHTPVVAIALAAGFAVIPMYLEFFTSFISAQVNAIFFYSVVWILAGVSAAVIPFVRRDIYESATGGRSRVPFISVLGVLGICLFAYLGYNSLTNPAVGPFAAGAQVFTAISVIIPAAIYAVAYFRVRRRGIDLRFLQSQIPPE